MSGTGDLPVVPGVSDHPDHDLLADLAAEVLADDLAEQVQTHVVDCAQCAGLLAEAEGIRALLRQSEPDRMPDDVMERLASVLAEVPPHSIENEPTITSPGRDDEKLAPAVPTPAGGVRAGGADQRRRLTPALPKNAAARAAVTAGETGRLTRITTRMSRPTESARRQAREEEQADRRPLLSRLAPLLKVAATLVVLLGVGGLVFQLFSGSDPGASDSAGTAAAGSAAPVVAPVQTTGTNYSEADLQKQVDTLIGASQRAALRSAATPSSAAPGTGTAESRARDSSASPLAAASAGALTSPTALRACLTAIGAADAQPVAVDLARWNDQDAAVIVLNADGGGYDVWVVARTCAPDADGTIAQEHLAS